MPSIDADGIVPTTSGARARALARELYRSNGAILAIPVIYGVVSLLVGPRVQWSGTGNFARGYVQLLGALLGVVVAVVPLRLLWHRHALGAATPTRQAWAAAWRTARTRELSATRLGGLLLVIAAIPLQSMVFSSWKASIPTFTSFAWDRRLAALDRALHGGRDAWTWLAPLYETPWLLHRVDELYALWFVPLLVVPPLVAWSRPTLARERFLVSYGLVWIVLGHLTATLFASAGPCYFAWATGVPPEADPFRTLMATLHAYVDPATRQPLFAVRAQAYLLDVRATTELGRGIAAFPSAHVAVVTLYALGARQLRPWLTTLAAAYALLILVGSVALGWHYAVDGYAGAAGAWAIWWAVGAWQRRRARPGAN